MRSDRERLLDISEAIENIDRYAVGGKEAYDADELLRAWMVRQLEVIGEAISQLSPELKAAHPDVRWRGIIAMRNQLIHAYNHIDPEIIWGVVIQDVPVLKDQVRELLGELDG